MANVESISASERIKRARIAAAVTRHGHSAGGRRTPEYVAWQSMIARCTNQKMRDFSRYGGRGISVCERWLASFENFFADVGLRPSKLHSIDRFPDKNGNYEPGNVRWATVEQQNWNRRDNKLIEYRGQKKCLAEWCDVLQLKYNPTLIRLRKGWTVEDAFNIPHGMYRSQFRRIAK